jgi:hypothetical protein
MPQIPARIFPRFHGRFQAPLRQRHPNIGGLLVYNSGDVPDSYFKALGMALCRSFRLNGDLRFRSVRGVPNSLLRIVLTVAHELTLTINNHLRSKGTFAFEPRDVLLLPQSPIRGGIQIHPTIVIPVVHVFFESDDLGTSNGLVCFELAQQRVCWWTGGTTLRGEQLDDNWSSIDLRFGGLCHRFTRGNNFGCHEQERPQG